MTIIQQLRQLAITGDAPLRGGWLDVHSERHLSVLVPSSLTLFGCLHCIKKTTESVTLSATDGRALVEMTTSYCPLAESRMRVERRTVSLYSATGADRRLYVRPEFLTFRVPHSTVLRRTIW
ncbi:unnamed protein product [Ectocarpus sp. 12 AP-2014]